MESLSQGSPDLDQMSRLLNGRQVPWRGAPAEEVGSFEQPNNQGFGILQDSLIFDLRGWQPVEPKEGTSTSVVFVYRRLKVFKKPEKTGDALFHVDLAATSPQTAVRFPTQQLEPTLRMSRIEGSLSGQKECHWRASYDFQHVPPGEFVDIIVEYHSPGQFLKRGSNGTTIRGPVRADTAELTAWILMPEGKEYRDFHISRYEIGKPGTAETVKQATEYLADDFSILAFKLLALKSGYMYEVSWTYR
jgi:hypothetical protein